MILARNREKTYNSLIEFIQEVNNSYYVELVEEIDRSSHRLGKYLFNKEFASKIIYDKVREYISKAEEGKYIEDGYI